MGLLARIANVAALDTMCRHAEQMHTARSDDREDCVTCASICSALYAVLRSIYCSYRVSTRYRLHLRGERARGLGLAGWASLLHSCHCQVLRSQLTAVTCISRGGHPVLPISSFSQHPRPDVSGGFGAAARLAYGTGCRLPCMQKVASFAAYFLAVCVRLYVSYGYF